MTTELKEWLKKSYPGAKSVYWTGNLLTQTSAGKKASVERQLEAMRISAIRDLAYQEYAAGRAELVQRRVAPGVFEYIIIRRHRDRKPKLKRAA
jgi:hypothetical protein